jgi:hypothetical protein
MTGAAGTARPSGLGMHTMVCFALGISFLNSAVHMYAIMKRKQTRLEMATKNYRCRAVLMERALADYMPSVRCHRRSGRVGRHAGCTFSRSVPIDFQYSLIFKPF